MPSPNQIYRRDGEWFLTCVVGYLLTVYNICKLTSAAGCCITLFSTADQTGYCSKPVSVSQPAAASSQSVHCRPLLQTQRPGKLPLRAAATHQAVALQKYRHIKHWTHTSNRQATTSSPTYSTAVYCHSPLIRLQQQEPAVQSNPGDTLPFLQGVGNIKAKSIPLQTKWVRRLCLQKQSCCMLWAC